MWFFHLLTGLRSLAICRGTHDYVSMKAFVIDPEGREWSPAFGGFYGRTTTYGRCSRCSRRDDGKGFDH